MKKLDLKKTTIDTLNNPEMDGVDNNKIKGGSYVHYSCLCAGTTSCTYIKECCTPEEYVEGDTV